MLDKIKYATIRDVCVTDIYFYEEDRKEELLQFCRDNFISYIPGKDRKTVYQLRDSSFHCLDEIPEELICSPTDLLFDEDTLSKFREGNHDEVMLVLEKGLVKGVVHIVDYNNDDLYVELYRMILKFENNLRRLLILKGYIDQDVVDWVLGKAKTSKKEKDRDFNRRRHEELMKQTEVEKRQTSNPFQSFYLRELLSFSFSKEILSKRDFNMNSISHIRNWISHSKDVTAIRPHSGHPVYNIDGLVEFINISRSFFDGYEKLELILEDSR